VVRLIGLYEVIAPKPCDRSTIMTLHKDVLTICETVLCVVCAV
jgi:hypothetical protein